MAGVPQGFRGRNPPASLKLWQSDRALSDMRGFPGEKSPGLIEATWSLCVADPDPLSRFRGRNPPASLKHGLVVVTVGGLDELVSGGEIPRPH